jgi:hypothetical protein
MVWISLSGGTTQPEEPPDPQDGSSSGSESEHEGDDEWAGSDPESCPDSELDEFDDEEEAAAEVLGGLRGDGAGQGGAESDDSEDEEEEAEYDGGSEEEEGAHKRQKGNNGPEARRRRSQLANEAKAKKRARAKGRFARGERGRFAKKPATPEEDEEEDQPQRQGLRPRSKKRKREVEEERRRREAERQRAKRAVKRQQNLEMLREAQRVLERALATDNIKSLIVDDEAALNAKGLGHRAGDFGRSALWPYRKRAFAILSWHNLVLDGERYEFSYRAAGVAANVHYNTLRQWVRGFHANDLKIGRLLSGLQPKTKSYLESKDLQNKARQWVVTYMSLTRRMKHIRSLKRLLDKVKKAANQVVARAEQASSQQASTSQSTEPETSTDSPAEAVFCTCRKPYCGDGSDMIWCESCDEWFHPTCIGMDEREFRRLKRAGDEEWMCKPCADKADAADADEGPTPEEALDAVSGGAPLPAPPCLQEVRTSKPLPKFTSRVFHAYCNDVLLRDIIANGGKPISLRTAQTWLGRLGFRWRRKKKTVYKDVHERSDVRK